MKFRNFIVLIIMFLAVSHSFAADEKSEKLDYRINLSMIKRARVNSIEWIARSCGKNGFEPKEIKGSKAGLSKVGKTALALLAISHCRETEFGDERFEPNFTDAARWLLRQVDTKRGNISISSINKLTPYEFALATYALSEICGMRRTSEFKPVVEKMFQLLVSGQNSDGGWSSEKGKPSSVSLTFWNALALKCAISSRIKLDGSSTLNCVEQLNKFLISAIDDSGLSSEYVGRGKKTRVHAYAAAYALMLFGEGRHQKVTLVKNQLFKQITTTTPSRYIEDLTKSVQVNQINYLLNEWFVVSDLMWNFGYYKYPLGNILCSRERLYPPERKFWMENCLYPAISSTQFNVFCYDRNSGYSQSSGYWKSDQVDQIDLSLFNFKAIIIRRRLFGGLPLYPRNLKIMEEGTGFFEDLDDDDVEDLLD